MRHDKLFRNPLASLIQTFSLSLTLLSTLTLLAGPAIAQQTWKATPFNTPSIPLAVRGPYVNVWAPQASGPAPLNIAWPRSWDFSLDIYGWYASIRVDGKPYYLMGDDTAPNSTLANQTSVIVTPTRSSYLYTAGPVTVNLTFLSPIEPNDPVKMSTPFSYFYATFVSADSSSHDVQFYSDISGEWISGDDSLTMTWSGDNSGTFTLLQTALQNPGKFQEIASRPQDGTAYYAVQNRNGISWQISSADPQRTAAANQSTLSNTADSSFHPVGDPFDVLGIMVDVGSVSSTPTDPLVYTIGVVRDPVVQYTNSKVQIETRSSYFWGTYSNVHDLIGAVLNNFTDALSAAEKLDAKLASEGGAVSSAYADLLAISTRQAFGAYDLTVARPSNGAVNMSDVKAFARDFGSVGSGGVNAVDVLYAAMPAYVYLWPDLLGHLLRPLLEYQESTQYTNAYAAEDIGGAYPNATGNFNGHDTKIEQSANMIIMALAHAQASGDGSLLAEHYDLFDNWAGYLVSNALTPGDDLSSASDGINAVNQSNIALKGIVGIGAMSKIAGYAGKQDNSSHYSGIAQQYIQQWTGLASTQSFISLSYGSSGSGLIYNMYADKLLQTNLIPSSVYQLQTSYYSNQLTKNSYGVPLDTNNPTLSRTDWMMFAAASVSDDSVRNTFIQQIHAYASAEHGNAPFAVLYNPTNGSQTTASSNSGGTGGMASFAQGAMFAPLALNVPIQSVTFGSSSSGSSGAESHKKNVGAIAGGVVGGLAAIGIIGFAIFYFMRRRERPAKGMYNQDDITTERIERIERVKKPVPLVGGGHALIEPYDNVMSSTGSVLAGVASLHGNDSRDFVRSNDSLLSGANTPGQYAPAEYVGGSWTFGNNSAVAGGVPNHGPFSAPSESARSRTDSFTTTPGVPLRVQNVAESEFSYGAGSSSGAGGSEIGTLVGSANHYGYGDKKGGKLPQGAKSPAPSLPPDALASEVAELRREIMQMRNANAGSSEMGMDVAPPSYEDDLLMAGSSSGGEQDPVMRRPTDVKRKI